MEMYTLLMLDDDLLFRRDNVVRRYGEAELRPDAVYTDPAMATPWPACWVFRLDDGCYRMLYLGAPRNELRQHYLLGAVSTDGVHFEPEDYTGEIDLEHRIAVNMIRAVGDEEIGAVFEDACTPSLSERYRMLTTGVVISAENDPETYYVRTTIYVSGDLLHWTRKAEIPPFRAEPLMSVFHNRAHSCMTIAHRPWWGIRKVGIRDTADWVNYSSYEPVMQADALDAPLAEVYGMTVFPYNGIYLGFPHIYSGAAPGLHAKFFGGTMRVQLAYSSDGHHWFRSLRTPLLSGCEGKKYGLPEWKMIWATGMLELPDRSLCIYAGATELEHGPAFQRPDTRTSLLTCRLRKDGFIRLSTADANAVSTVATRECIWHGGESHWNLRADRATVAVYESGDVKCVDMNILGYCKPVAGFSHGDCIPFSGDSTDWIPRYRGGRNVASLTGHVLCFEIRFENGDFYSFSGNATFVFNVEGERYRQTGRLPER